MSGPALRRDDTGFLLLPLAALVFSSAVLLAVVFGLSVLARPGCHLGDVLDYPCSGMFVRMSNFFNLMAVPGVLVFAWQTRLHRRRTRPLEPGMFRAAEEVTARVLASVTLPRPTPVVLGPRLGRRAFTGGTDDKPYVALGPELLALPGKGPPDRAVFEAVLRHELAHVQNHDLLRLRFATALRISTRVTALATALLLVAELAWAPAPPTVGSALGVVVRAAAVALGAELAVRAFLRVREQQADRRAAEADPAAIRAALHRRLRVAARDQTRRAGAVTVGRERRGLRERLLSRHPSVARRLAALDDDGATLALPLGQLLAGGVFAGVALINAQLLVELLLFAEVLTYPEGGGQPWAIQAVLALPVIPVALFLTYGCWRDTRAWRLAGRPARPWLLGALFGLGMLAGTYLAPYVVLVRRTREGEVPPLPGLVVFAIVGALLCRWLVALLERAAPGTARHRRLLLLPATPVTVGALLLAWQVGQRLIGRAFECDHHVVADCGPLGTLSLTAAALGTPLAAAVLVLAVVTLLVVTVRRAGRTALVAAAGAALAGGLLAVALPRLPGADTLTLSLWATLDGRLDAPMPALALQVALVVAVAVAALTPRATAGPLAGAAAALVLAAGVGGQLSRLADGPLPIRPGDVSYAVGIFLGGALAIVLLAAAGTVTVRRLARGRDGPADPGTGAGRHAVPVPPAADQPVADVGQP